MYVRQGGHLRGVPRSSSTARAVASQTLLPFFCQSISKPFIEQEFESTRAAVEMPFLTKAGFLLSWRRDLCASLMIWNFWIPRSTETAILELQKWNFDSLFVSVSGFSVTFSPPFPSIDPKQRLFLVERKALMRSERCEGFWPSKRDPNPPSKGFGS